MEATPMDTKISLSVVSHGHQRYICRLFEDLAQLNRDDIEVILTLNLPEEIPIDFEKLPFKVKVICNDSPKGLAANHNAAFGISQGDHFVVLNPDIKFIDDPFDTMLSIINDQPNSICAPLIINDLGGVEDSARHFPTPALLLKRSLSRMVRLKPKSEAIPNKEGVLAPDWVAGMFLFIPRAIYVKLHGLSERYHLYFEDVDFCARAHLTGHQILVSANAKVIHEAQRDSHRKLRYFLWHLQSAIKFFTSKAYQDIRNKRILRKQRL
jgi:N-acetylglucosaminyl-diphospho-decaprenol L-rhamnosyltransferase